VEVPASGILSLSAPRRRCRMSHLGDYRVQEYRLPSPFLLNVYNVLSESLSVDSQNIPCATLKKRGSWVICVYLCFSLTSFTQKPDNGQSAGVTRRGQNRIALEGSQTLWPARQTRRPEWDQEWATGRWQSRVVEERSSAPLQTFWGLRHRRPQG
jgi:hypothetical protein